MPDDWSDYAWGEHPGWYGPPVAFSGMETGPDGTARPTFAAIAAREMQIDRDLSRAAWWFMFELRALGPDRANTLTWPAGAKPEDARTWVELDLSE